MMSFATLAFVVVVVLVLATQIFKVLNEYERGVVFTFGRFTGVKGPGLIILIPLIQKMVKVDLRVIVLDVPTQDVISRDNVSVKVNAVVYFRIVDPAKAIIQVANPFEATSQLAQTTLRSVLGQHELDTMLSQRDKLNVDIQRILDHSTDAWGIKVATVEIKHVDLNENMIRAMAKQAEAERTRRAKIIHAEGEKQAAAQLVEAAAMLGHGAQGAAAALPADARRHLEREDDDDRLPAADGPPPAIHKRQVVAGRGSVLTGGSSCRAQERLEPLRGDGRAGAQLLRVQRQAELLDGPAQLGEPRIPMAFGRGRFERAQRPAPGLDLRRQPPIACRVAAQPRDPARCRLHVLGQLAEPDLRCRAHPARRRPGARARPRSTRAVAAWAGAVMAFERRSRLREALRNGAHDLDRCRRRASTIRLRPASRRAANSRFVARQRTLAEHRRRHRAVRDLVEDVAAQTGRGEPAA